LQYFPHPAETHHTNILVEAISKNASKGCLPVADPGGAVWGNCPTNPLWRPLEWRPFAINAPFLVPMEIETDLKIL